MMYKYWNIEIDGIDRVGKNTLAPYLTFLSNYRFAIKPRGLLTQLVYSKKFNRSHTYEYTSYKEHTVIVLLYADEEDLKERFWNTNEKTIDMTYDMKMFNDAANELIANKFKVLKYNTSHITHYDIAKDILSNVDKWESQL